MSGSKRAGRGALRGEDARCWTPCQGQVGPVRASQGIIRPVAPGPERISPMARERALSVRRRSAMKGGRGTSDALSDGGMATSLRVGFVGQPSESDRGPGCRAKLPERVFGG